MRNGLIGLLISLCLALPGCQQQSQSPSDEPSEPATSEAAAQTPAPEPPSVATVPGPVTPRVPATGRIHRAIPPVLLSEQHRAWCKVFVGDKLPTIHLPDLTGKETHLADLYGHTGTVIVFWQDRGEFSTERLRDAQWEISANFKSAGVEVVGIFHGSDAAVAQRRLAEAEADFPCLVDTAGRAWTKVGSEEPIRTYLLDQNGEIVWFDLGYDRSSRRELSLALTELTDSRGE